MACLSCAFTEATPEEKLQKLHTDIKFALKVDNPVSKTFCPFYTVWKNDMLSHLESSYYLSSY